MIERFKAILVLMLILGLFNNTLNSTDSGHTRLVSTRATCVCLKEGGQLGAGR